MGGAGATCCVFAGCASEEGVRFTNQPRRRWFDRHMEDGLIERVLPVVPDAGKLVPYTFILHTTDIKGAGTDAGNRMHGIAGMF